MSSHARPLLHFQTRLSALFSYLNVSLRSAATIACSCPCVSGQARDERCMQAHSSQLPGP